MAWYYYGYWNDVKPDFPGMHASIVGSFPVFLYLCIMRLKPEIVSFIKEMAIKLSPEVEIYLFGSRLNDQERGGDIDLLILSEQKIDSKKLRRFRICFYKKFGWQKIDLVNFTKKDNSTFKKLILTSAQHI